MSTFLNRFLLSTIVIYLSATVIAASFYMVDWNIQVRWYASVLWFISFVISSLATFGEKVNNKG